MQHAVSSGQAITTPSSGGVFVQGGTMGNLSALVAARHRARSQRPDRPRRWSILAGEEAHSSIAASADVMDVDVIVVPSVDRRLQADRAADVIAALDADEAARLADRGQGRGVAVSHRFGHGGKRERSIELDVLI